MTCYRLSVLALVFALTACSEPPANELLAESSQSAKQILSQFKAKKNRVKDYAEARRVFWQALYPNTVTSLYCGQKFNSRQRSGFNIEHVFPMSWVTNGLQCGTRKQCRKSSATFNKIEADLHNLYPSRSDVNEKRSSFRFGVINGEKRRFGKACDFEYDARQRVAEPAPNVRGDVARAMFYMAREYKQYGLVIFKRQAALLRDWHQSDPPSPAEKKRNDAIEKIQGNRNPFIDEPDSLVQSIQQGHFAN